MRRGDGRFEEAPGDGKSWDRMMAGESTLYVIDGGEDKDEDKGREGGEERSDARPPSL